MERKEIEITGLKPVEVNELIAKLNNAGMNWKIDSRIKWGTTGYVYIKYWR